MSFTGDRIILGIPIILKREMRTSELTDLILKNHKCVGDMQDRTPEMRVASNIRNAADAFLTEAYENIRQIHSKSRVRGWTADFLPGEIDKSGMKIMTYCVMGRVVITIKNPSEDSITLIGPEEKSKVKPGLQSIDCPPDVALDMLEVLTSKWYMAYSDRGLTKINKFKEDKKTCIV
jgi:hypothetical protein